MTLTPHISACAEVTLFHNDLRLSLSRFVRILYVDDRVSLVLCDVTPDMAGQYTVRAVNPAGEATTTATLHVQGEPARRTASDSFSAECALPGFNLTARDISRDTGFE